MSSNGERLLSPKDAAKRLGVSTRTLVIWADSGKIKCIRPGGDKGKRLYDVTSVGTFVGPASVSGASDMGSDESDAGDTGCDVIYARVSTRKQLGDLQRQVDKLESKYPGCTVFRDCASGLNFKRKGLKALLELVFAKRVRRVHVAHRDRLCRFAYDLLQFVLQKHGAEIVVDEHDGDAAEPERELAEDVLSVITVFGARLHGKRSGGKRGSRKRKRTEEEAEEAADSNDELQLTLSGDGRDGAPAL